MKTPLMATLALLVLSACEKTTLSDKPDTGFENRILDEYFVNSMAFDLAGNAWIGTFKQGLIKYSPSETIVYNSSNSIISDDWVIRDIEIDRRGNVWLATEGLVKYDGKEFIHYNTGNSDIPEDIVWEIEIDSGGNLWMSSGRFNSGGLARFNGSQWKVYTPENSPLPANHIQGIAIDAHDNVWLAVADYVEKTYLAKISGEQWSFVSDDDLGFTPYYFGNIRVNRRNQVCGSIDYSLSSRWDNERTQVFIYKGDTTEQFIIDSIHNVRSLYIDNQDNIWCIAYGGYAVYDGSEWFSDQTTFRESSVFAIEQARDGKIWIGTGEGIYINN